jgi:hypothetical protein
VLPAFHWLRPSRSRSYDPTAISASLIEVVTPLAVTDSELIFGPVSVPARPVFTPGGHFSQPNNLGLSPEAI